MAFSTPPHRWRFACDPVTGGVNAFSDYFSHIFQHYHVAVRARRADSVLPANPLPFTGLFEFLPAVRKRHSNHALRAYPPREYLPVCQSAQADVSLFSGWPCPGCLHPCGAVGTGQAIRFALIAARLGVAGVFLTVTGLSVYFLKEHQDNENLQNRDWRS